MLTNVADWKKLHQRIIKEDKILDCHKEEIQKGCRELDLNPLIIKMLTDRLSVPRSKEALHRLKTIENGTFPQVSLH